MANKVPYKYIREAFAKGRVIPFFGAGASVGAHFDAVIGRAILRDELHEIFNADYEPLAIHH